MRITKLLLLMTISFALFAGCTSTQTDTQLPNSPANEQPSSETLNDTEEDMETITVKLGLFPYSSYAPLYYAMVEGYYAEQGIEIEIVDFRKQADAVVALATGQIDVSGGVLDVSSLAAIGEDTGLKIVADKGYVDPNATCPYGAWMARNDILDSGELENLKNMAGKKVVLTKAGFFEYAMDQLLAPEGLNVNDLDIIEMPVPSRLEAFQTGAIDIGQVGEPWITRTLETNSAEVWLPFEAYLQNAQYAVLWFGPTITEENPEAGYRFMTAYLQAVQQYNQGKTERNVALMAEFTKSTLEEASTACWQAFTSSGNINIEFVDEFQQWALEKDYLDRALSVDEFWDGRFLEYAQENLP
jgi:NitT/TauT family transport system substrate-binding protein